MYTQKSGQNHKQDQIDTPLAMQELIRLELKLQARISAVRNASASNLSYQYIQEENDAIKVLFSELDAKIKEWKRKANEEVNSKEAEAILEQLRRHSNEIGHMKESLRKANLKVKIEREKQAIQDRRNLLDAGGLSSDSDVRSRKVQIRTQEDALKESKNVIDGLKRLRSMMAAEVTVSNEILGELDDQGKVMGSAVQNLDEMTNQIKKGRGWLSLLKRREVTDKLLVMMALVFFVCVCFYIVKVRLRITFFGIWP